MASSDFPPFVQLSAPNRHALLTLNRPPHRQLTTFRPSQPRTTSIVTMSHTGGEPQIDVQRANVLNGSFYRPSVDSGIYGAEETFDALLPPAHDRNTFAETRPLSSWYEINTYPSINFRPAESYPREFATEVEDSTASSLGIRPLIGDVVGVAGKQEGHVCVPTATILPHQVDASEYENIDDNAWVLSSIEYGADSPASFDSQDIGPYTPASPVPGAAYYRSFSGPSTVHGAVGKTESLNLGQPQVIQPYDAYGISTAAQLCSNASHCTSIQPTPLSTIFNAAQPLVSEPLMFNNHSHAHGLPIHNQPSQELRYPVSTQADPIDLLRPSMESEMETSPEPSEKGNEGEYKTDGDDGYDTQDDALQRRERDRYLLNMRAKGFSYKEIKRRGQYKEAESTLRGRVRVLTKAKSERVRKPEWTENDRYLLLHAVHHMRAGYGSRSRGDSYRRMPWKKISQWMHEAGSSYVFAPATCARKWREIKE